MAEAAAAAAAASAPPLPPNPAAVAPPAPLPTPAAIDASTGSDGSGVSQARRHLILYSRRQLAMFTHMDTDIGRDREARRHGDPQMRHQVEARPLSTEARTDSVGVEVFLKKKYVACHRGSHKWTAKI